MEIKSIFVTTEGYVHCRSVFYSAQDCISSCTSYCFSKGINKLIGEIDSGIWAISYLLSMYDSSSDDFILFEKPTVTVNQAPLTLHDFLKYSCYMDRRYPLFSANGSIRELVCAGITNNKLDTSPDEIKDLFCMDADRFERPLSGVGNELFKAMAAIGYTHKREVFCFPWLSHKRVEGYHKHITGLLNILADLGKVVILPIGK